MKLKVEVKPISQLKADVAVLLVEKDKEYFTRLPKIMQGPADKYLQEVKKKRAKREMVVRLERGGISNLYLYSPVLIKGFNSTEALKIIANNVYNYCKGLGWKECLFVLNGKQGAEAAGLMAEGLLLGTYNFDKYLKEKERFAPTFKATLLVDEKDKNSIAAKIKKTQILAGAINACRDVVNDSPEEIYPASLAQRAQEVAKHQGLTCLILDEKKLKEQNYNAILAVGRGSKFPPRLVIMQYHPEGKAKAYLCLVGKGITFDTGGLCLKEPKHMWVMKSDMAGAAAVIYLMQAIAELKPQIAVTGIVPLAQNALGPEAVLPGEIIVSSIGKTIHILNTDAEGRLILADALAHAGKEKATHIVDIATLTGSCIMALGTSISGIMGNDEAWMNEIIACGKQVGEDIWPLPLYEEYRLGLKSDVADINNISSNPHAGAINAALFLQEFVPKGVKWAHLDIAGTAFAEKKWKYFRPGATGVGIRTVIELISQM